MKMASWNNLSGEISLEFTNLNVFESLISTGSIPTDIDYGKKLYDMIKWNVLKKTKLTCREDEWLICHTSHLYKYISIHWKENKGVVDQNDPVFKNIIKPHENPNHSCSKCDPNHLCLKSPLSLPKKSKKIALIPKEVIIYKFNIKKKYCICK